MVSGWGRAGVAAFRLSGRPLATGDTFDVVVLKADQEKMKMAFDLQWSLIRTVLGVCGGRQALKNIQALVMRRLGGA